MFLFDLDIQYKFFVFDGCCVQLYLCGFEFVLVVMVEQGQLWVGLLVEDSQLCVVVLLGSLFGMLLCCGDDGVVLGKVEIVGDVDFVCWLEKLVSIFVFDFEEVFVCIFGDVFGVLLVCVICVGFVYVKDIVIYFIEDGVDWVCDEVQLVMGLGEVDGFFDGVDVLCECSECLEV